MASKPSILVGYPKHLKIPYGPYMGAVDGVYDGDTPAVTFDLGLKQFPVFYVRLRDVRAPEMHEEGGPETRDYLSSIIPYGSWVHVFTDSIVKVEGWSFDRVVGQVLLNGTTDVGPLVNQFVRENGFPVGN